VHKERFPNVEAYARVRGSYRIDNATLKHAKPNMIVLHPLPRNEEIAEEVDYDQRAAYFRQVSLTS
jgi:carbamoyl-phosphate synthase / aspartate carbamoyltransferase